jgi:hypothetical protein
VVSKGPRLRIVLLQQGVVHRRAAIDWRSDGLELGPGFGSLREQAVWGFLAVQTRASALSLGHGDGDGDGDVDDAVAGGRSRLVRFDDMGMRLLARN